MASQKKAPRPSRVPSALTDPRPLPDLVCAPRLSIAQVSELMRVSRDTVNHWLTGRPHGVVLRSFRIGARRFIFRSDLEYFLRACQEVPFLTNSPAPRKEVAHAG
jgi:hypothetical protein